MKSNLLVACRFGFALLGFSVAASAALDIAQIPLANCLTDAAYRSASAVAVDPVGGIIYQAKYSATDWSGKLLAYQADSTTGILAATPLWEAGDVLPDDYTLRRPYSFFFPDDDCNSGESCPYPLLTGTVFKWKSTATLPGLSGRQQQYINWGPGAPEGGYKQKISEYFAGSRLDEKPTKFLRQRLVLLGDLINSDPWFVGSEDFNYSSLPGAEGTSYQAFQNQKSLVVGGNTPRPRMVYVGGNDGMLHGFKAGTWNSASKKFDTGNGTEVFSFLPGSIINSNLRLRSIDPFAAQDHRYLVDGSPRAGDAYFSGAWHTVLLGTTGASPLDPLDHWPKQLEGTGGRSIFALDVTNPNDFTTTATGVGKVLWEFTDNRSVIGAFGFGADLFDLGMTLSQPSLARMQNGKWAVIVGNGYNSQNQKPVLYLLDISLKPYDPDFIIAKISPCDASPKPSACLNGNNGLSTPIAVDVDSDRKVDYIYAGDLQGNLWKFDVTSSSSSNWKVANGGNPLFIACATSGTSCSDVNNRQPITGKPQVGSVSPEQANALYDKTQTKPTISVMVYFGTGKYLGLTDIEIAGDSSKQQQTFYALWDKNTGDADTDKIEGRSKLLQQQILTGSMTRAITLADKSQSTETVTNVRVTSKNAPCYPKSCNTPTTTQHKGWYMDLTTPSASPSERSVGFPLLINGNILFTTFTPPAGFNPTFIPCTTPSPSSWLMELDAITGSRLASSPFDLFGGVATVPAPDGKFNSFDLVTVDSAKDSAMAPSGIQSTVGILKTPAIIPGKGLVNKYVGGSTGDAPQRVTDPGESIGRISWRQLR